VVLGLRKRQHSLLSTRIGKRLDPLSLGLIASNFDSLIVGRESWFMSFIVGSNPTLNTSTNFLVLFGGPVGPFESERTREIEAQGIME